MKTTAFSLLLLAATVAAQDPAATAADLFYRAYWLEHASGRTAEAEAAYQQFLKRHAAAAEAPRALLGLIRLRAADGRDAADLVALLTRKYPDAKREIEAAQRLAARTDEPFSARVQEGDSAALRKVKELYARLLEADLPAELNLFLADLGPVAHPALRALLHATDPHPVGRAAMILLMQRSPAADAVLKEALADKTVLFRTTIVDTIARQRSLFRPSLVDPVAALYDGSAPMLRQRIVRAMKAVLEVDSKNATAYAVLGKALSEKEPIRYDAMKLKRPSSEWPDTFAEAFVAALERDPHVYRDRVVLLANRPALAARIEKILRSTSVMKYRIPNHDAGCLLLARVMSGVVERGEPSRAGSLVHFAMTRSSAAARWVVLRVLNRGDSNLVQIVQNAGFRKVASDDRAAIRKAAVTALVSDANSRREAAYSVLSRLPLEPADWPEIRKAADSKRGVVHGLVNVELIRALGPARALELARLCRDAGQHDRLLKASQGFAEDKAARPLYEYLLPRTSPGSAGTLGALAGRGLADMVALHLLSRTAPEWGWQTTPSTRPAKGWGPGVWRQTAAAWTREPVRSALRGHVTDPRWEIARSAVETMGHDSSAEAIKALGQALHSPWHQMRSAAIKYLDDRGAAGADELLAYARTRKAGYEDALSALRRCATPRHAAGLRAFILERKGDSRRAWRVYEIVAPKAAVDLALEEVKRTDGDVEDRDAALRTLSRTADARRLAVFRDVLDGKLPGLDVGVVIDIVGEQYLIELGPAVLRHLRSPDSGVRSAAKTAIESLKFYAEARKAFSD